jgi:hypothetical protein
VKTVTVQVEDGEVLVAIKRPEDYEDVHPELVVLDAIRGGWECRVVESTEAANGD